MLLTLRFIPPQLGALASCSVPWKVVVCLGLLWEALPAASFWGLFSFISAVFEELLSFKLKKSPQIDLNGLFGNEWPLESIGKWSCLPRLGAQTFWQHCRFIFRVICRAMRFMVLIPLQFTAIRRTSQCNASIQGNCTTAAAACVGIGCDATLSHRRNLATILVQQLKYNLTQLQYCIASHSK